MQTYQPNVFLGRDDTILGVCEAIGEDFRINATVLRVLFALGFFFNPVAAVAVYLALGVVVMISRLVVRNPKPVGQPVEAAAEPAPVEAEQDEEQMELAIAA